MNGFTVTQATARAPHAAGTTNRKLYALFCFGLIALVIASCLAKNVVASVEQHAASVDHSRKVLTRLATVLGELNVLQNIAWTATNANSARQRQEFLVSKHKVNATIAELEQLLRLQVPTRTELHHIAKEIEVLKLRSHQGIDAGLIEEVRALAATIAQSEKRMVDNAERAEQQSFVELNRWLWVIGACGGLLAIVLHLLVRRDVNLQRELHTILESEVKERTIALSVANDKLQRLSAHLQQVSELERVRIARDLHDELGSTLTALKLELAYDSCLAFDHANFVSRQQASLALVDSAMRSVQTVVTELRPALLERFGVWEALAAKLQQFQERTQVQCCISLDKSIPAPEGEQATHVYRIVEEALTNISRHANATRLQIAVAKNQDLLTISIADNGCGVKPQQVLSTHAYGLLGMVERARLCNGRLQISGLEPNGTLIQLHIPFQKFDACAYA